MKKVSKFILLSLLCVGFVSFASCDDDEPEIIDPDETPSLPDVPAEDVVNNTYSGVVVNLTSNDQMMNYLYKRFTNVTTTIQDNADLILLDDATSQSVLLDADKLSYLQQLWNEHTAYGFVNPSINSVQLIRCLENQSSANAPGSTVSQQEMERFNGISLYVVTADRQYLVMEKQTGVLNTESNNDNKATTRSVDDQNAMYTDHILGHCAEKAVVWLNNNSIGKKDNASSAFISRSDSPYTYDPIKMHVILNSYKIDHPNILKQYLSKGFEDHIDEYRKVYSWTLTPEVIIEINAGYYVTGKQDFYDVKITEVFPGSYDDGVTMSNGNLNNTSGAVIHNFCFYSHLAYKCRYSGGIYLGPTVDSYLSNDENSFNYSSENVVVESPVPTAGIDSSNYTHYPGNWNLGGSVAVGASATGIDGSGSFSFGYTCPTTTISYNKSNMGFTYNNIYNCRPSWNYQSDITIYESHWGSNPSFNYPSVTDLPECNRSHLETTQAFSFLVSNTESLEDTHTILNTKVDFKLYFETCGPEIIGFDQQSYIDTYSWNKAIELPKINRFFGTYRPSFYASDAKADSEGWTNISTMLMQHPDYCAFSSEEIQVGGTTEQGVVNSAISIWENCINEIVEEYSSQVSNGTYIIALKCEESKKYLEKGIRVSPKGWEVVVVKDAKAELNKAE